MADRVAITGMTRSVRSLTSLHESLLRRAAYPADASELRETRRALQHFARRTDLARFKDSLGNSGIAGTRMVYRFYWATALWLAERWPSRLVIDWEEFENQEQLARVLPSLLPFTESLALDNSELDVPQLIDLLKGSRETDATFIINLFAAAPVPESWRELTYENLDIPIALEPGKDTPSRTLARYKPSTVSYSPWPPDSSRPELSAEIGRGPEGVEPESGQTARR